MGLFLVWAFIFFLIAAASAPSMPCCIVPSPSGAAHSRPKYTLYFSHTHSLLCPDLNPALAQISGVLVHHHAVVCPHAPLPSICAAYDGVMLSLLWFVCISLCCSLSSVLAGEVISFTLKWFSHKSPWHWPGLSGGSHFKAAVWSSGPHWQQRRLETQQRLKFLALNVNVINDGCVDRKEVMLAVETLAQGWVTLV